MKIIMYSKAFLNQLVLCAEKGGFSLCFEGSQIRFYFKRNRAIERFKYYKNLIDGLLPSLACNHQNARYVVSGRVGNSGGIFGYHSSYEEAKHNADIYSELGGNVEVKSL